MTTPHNLHDSSLLRMKDVVKLTGLHRSSIYYNMKNGSFPKSFKIGLRAAAWRKKDILNWIKQMQEEGIKNHERSNDDT